MITKRTDTGVVCEMQGALLLADEGRAYAVKVGMNQVLDRCAPDDRVALVMTKPLATKDAQDLLTAGADHARAFRELLIAHIEDAKRAGQSDPEAVGLYLTFLRCIEVLAANTIAMSPWPEDKSETDFQTDMLAFIAEVSRETLTLDRIHDLRDVSAEAAAAAPSHEIPQGPTEEG